jgi:hypothetical protein
MLMSQLASSGPIPLAAVAGGGLNLNNPDDIYVGLASSRPIAEAVIQVFGLATRDAHVERRFIVRADGRVISQQNHGHQQRASVEKTAQLQGDAIVIPVRLTAGSGWKRLEGITRITSQSANAIASFAVPQR